MWYSSALPEGDNERPLPNLSIWQAIAFATELGVAFTAAVIIGVFLGHIVDVQLDNNIPVATFLGAFLGLGAGVYSMIQIAQWLSKPRKE